jgi:hypothetical protein
MGLITHTTKIVGRLLRSRIERKTEDVLGEDQFGFRTGRGTMDILSCLSHFD